MTARSTTNRDYCRGGYSRWPGFGRGFWVMSIRSSLIGRGLPSHVKIGSWHVGQYHGFKLREWKRIGHRVDLLLLRLGRFGSKQIVMSLKPTRLYTYVAPVKTGASRIQTQFSPQSCPGLCKLQTLGCQTPALLALLPSDVHLSYPSTIQYDSSIAPFDDMEAPNAWQRSIG